VATIVLWGMAQVSEYEYRIYVPNAERPAVDAAIERLKTEEIRYEGHRIVSMTWVGPQHVDVKLEVFDDRPPS
jgi:hypothetical protein